jgi:hypothetical protein
MPDLHYHTQSSLPHGKPPIPSSTEDPSRARACAFVDDFIRRSPWVDQFEDHVIAVHWDLIPTMEELETYGDLEAGEGTRACRRFFRAVVVWDDLGRGLWERLRLAAEQKRAALAGLGPLLRMGVVGSPAPSVSGEASGQASEEEVSSDGVRRGSDQSTLSEGSTTGRAREYRRSSQASTGAIPRIFRTMMGRSRENSNA